MEEEQYYSDSYLYDSSDEEEEEEKDDGYDPFFPHLPDLKMPPAPFINPYADETWDMSLVPNFDFITRGHRRKSFDGALPLRRDFVKEMASDVSGIELFSIPKEKEPNAPLGSMTLEKALNVVYNRKRIWFPLPVGWRRHEGLEDTGLYFVKKPSPYKKTPIDMEKVWAPDPRLKARFPNLEESREDLRSVGPDLYQLVLNTAIDHDKLDTSSASVEVETRYRLDLKEPMPTHILVIKQDDPEGVERHEYYAAAVHDFVLLLYCNNIEFPPRLETPTRTVNLVAAAVLPVAQITVPYPHVIGKLLMWIYTPQNEDAVANAFDVLLRWRGFPDDAQEITTIYLIDMVETSTSGTTLTEQERDNIALSESRISELISENYSYERLVSMMRDANCQWENIIALGFCDLLYEHIVLLARKLLFGALVQCVVREKIV